MNRIIQTERMILRPINKNDAKDIFEWVSDPIVNKYMPYNLYENKYLKLSLGGFINFTDLNNNSIFPFTMLNDISFGPIINLSLYSADVFDINLNLHLHHYLKLSLLVRQFLMI